MKSIKQQYIDLKEGRMNQAQFMRNVRMSLPQYVTNITSFDDTVRILKNKAILTEADIKSPLSINGKIVASYTQNGDKSYSVAYENGDTETIAVSNDVWDKINALDKNSTGLDEADIYGIAGDPEAEAERKAAGMGIKPMQTPEDKYGVNKKIDQSELNFLKKIYAKTPTDKIKQMIDNLENRMNLNESYTTNTSGKELYSKFAEIDNLNGQEVLIGIDYEIEKNSDLTKKEAAKIVVKNLKKNPFYYTDSLLAGVEGAKAEYMNKFKPGSDKMRDVKGGDLVDKANAMSLAKDVKKVNASANKAKKETNKPETGIKMMSLVAKTVRGVKKMDPTGEKMKKLALKENQEAYIDGLTQKIIDELESRGSYDSNEKLELIQMYQKKYNFSDEVAKKIDDNIFMYNADERYDDGSELDEYSTMPGGDNMTDVAGHQIDEAKASSLSVGDKFKISANLGKFIEGEEVEVVSLEPFGNDIKLVLSNGKDEDDFYLDRNDEI